MATKVKEKQYRIMQSFVYKGKDGTSKISVTLGPGEKVPDLDDEILQPLLKKNYIVEVDEKTGENILQDIPVDVMPLEFEQCRHLIAQLKVEHKNAYDFLKRNKFAKKSLLMLKELFKETIIQAYVNNGGLASDFNTADPDMPSDAKYSPQLNRWTLLFHNEIESRLLAEK